MFDIHNHYLAAVDDGPDTLEESLALARIAAEQGITHVVCTPHYHPGRYAWNHDNIINTFNALQTALAANAIPLNLGLAAEIHVTDEIIFGIKRWIIPFCGEWQGKKAMLLEMPHAQVPPSMEKLIKWLLKEGIQPIVVHPERNKAIMRNIQLAEGLVQAGALFQLTAGAVAGHFGENAQKVALTLLDNNVVQFIASDAHNAKRPPAMKPGYDAVYDYALQRFRQDVGAATDLAQRLTLDNPRQLTSGLFNHGIG